MNDATIHDMIAPRQQHVKEVAAKQAIEGISVTLSQDLTDEEKLAQASRLINFYRSIHKATSDPSALEGWY